MLLQVLDPPTLGLVLNHPKDSAAHRDGEIVFHGGFCIKLN